MRISKRTKRVFLAIVVVLLALRIALPFMVTRYVNRVLADLPDYRGEIEGVSIRLYRGAYQIHELRIFKIEGSEEVPFVYSPLIDLSVQWGALFHGSLVGEVLFTEPAINFIGGGSDDDQNGGDVDWTEPVKELFPLRINNLEIQNGKLAFQDLTTKPPVDIYISNIRASASNLTNVVDETDLLPSEVHFSGTSLGGGSLSINMRMNALKAIPDLDMDLEFENVDMPALNSFFDAYANIDIEEGDFNLYSEIAVLDGAIEGYVKPIVNDLKVVDWKNDKDRPARLIWESIVGLLAEVFENQPEDQFATEAPIKGNLNDVETSVWPTIWNIFRNAFVEAFEKSTDNSITIESPA